MCGRYTLRVSSAELPDLFGVINQFDWSPRYNIAPTQTVAAVRQVESGNGRELALLKWGLILSWGINNAKFKEGIQKTSSHKTSGGVT